MDDDEELPLTGAASPRAENANRGETPPVLRVDTAIDGDQRPLPQPPRDTTHQNASQSSAPSDAVDVDEREVLFLIANYLEKRDESKHAAQVLIADLSTNEGLGESVAWNGTPKTSTYADYKRRHRDLGPDHLLHILKTALTAKSASTSASVRTSSSLLLKSRAHANRTALTPTARKAMQTEIIEKTLTLRKLQRTEALVRRIVSKYDRMKQFLEDSRVESLPWDVRQALASATDTNVNLTALAADVRAVRQLIQVRDEKGALQSNLYSLLSRAKDAGAMQSTARTGSNHVTRLHRREVTMRAPSPLPPTYIYSRFRRLKTLNGHLQTPAFCMTYDKTGKFVITGADDRLIKIWSLRTGDLLFSLRGHVGNITDLAVNHSNTLLASSSDDKTVRVWELHTGAPVAVLLGHTSVVNVLRFHPTKNIVVTAADDGVCLCHKVPDIALVDEPETKEQTAKRLIDLGAYLLTLRPAMSLSHAASKPSVRSNKIWCMNFSRCGKYVVTGGQDGMGRVWDVSSLSDPESAVVATDFSVGPQEIIGGPAIEATNAAGQIDALALRIEELVAPTRAPVDGGARASTDAVSMAVEMVDIVTRVQGLLAPTSAAIDLAATSPDPASALRDIEAVVGRLQGLVAPTDAAVQIIAAAAGVDAAALAADLPNAVAMPQPAAIQQPAQPPRRLAPLPAVPPPDATQRQQPQLAEVQQSRHVAVDFEQVTKITEPVALLKGHTGPVTNILFNNKGDRIATASMKDGTARVWRWEKKYKKISHTQLYFDEHDRDRDYAMMYGLSSRNKRPPAVDTLVWTTNDDHLITLHSTKPDSATGEGDWRQRMRIWNPATGKLEKTLSALDPDKHNGHVNAVFAMDAHPTDPRIVVTGGHDGRVIIWDIEAGRILKSFLITSAGGETEALLDGSFTPTGDGFCFTDRIGRLCIFGTGSGEHLSAAPVQQYYYSDYGALMTDRNFHVIDRETQRAPSLMESGPLMDIFRVQYPHQPPHLLASRGAWTPEEYEANRIKRVQQSTESEVANKVRHVPADDPLGDEEDFPSVVLKPPTPRAAATGPPLLAASSYRLNGDPVLQAEIMRRNWNRIRLGQQRARQRASPSSEERDTSVLNMEISSEDDRSDEDFQVPAVRTSANRDADEEDDEDEDESEDESELDEDDYLSDASDAPEGERLRRRRARRPNSARGQRLGGDSIEEGALGAGVRSRRSRALARARVVQDDEDEDGNEGEGDAEDEDEDGEGRSRRQFRGRSRSHSAETLESASGAVVVETNDGFLMGDNQPDKFDTTVTYEQMLQAKLDQHAASGSSSEPPVIVCAFCGEGDDGGLLKLPGDAMGVHPIVNASQRLFVHDQCTIASPLCFHRNGKWYNVTKEIRRGRSIACSQCKRRGATIGCNIERCSKSYHWKCAVSCGWTLNQIHFYCPDHASQNGGQSAGATVADREMQHRFGLRIHREWLQLTSLAGVFTYVPQAGDYVVYFPQGHADFLRVTELKEPAFLRQVARFVSLKCKITSVKYAFPTLAEYRVGPGGQKAIQCDVELAVLAVPAAAFPSQPTIHADEKEEKKEEEESDEPVSGDAVFAAATTPFSKFVSVNKFLHPATDAACERLTIKLRFLSNDISTFLVLDHAYESGVAGEWQVGQRVRTPMIELDQGLQTSVHTSFGTIERVDAVPSVANAAILTPWNSVFVRWDAEDEDDCAVSPWELEPATRAEFASKRERDHALVATRLASSRRLSLRHRQLLADAISAAMELSIAKDFVLPVGSEYVDYWVTIPLPIDLTKIRDRVLAGYYRQLEAFIADVELVQTNCETYNVSTSAIAQSSRSVTSSILTSAQQIFPEFFAGYSRESTMYAYPPTDFGVNDDDDGVTGDELEFEEEGRRVEPVVAVDEALVAAEEPAIKGEEEGEDEIMDEPPVRATRSMRSSAAVARESTAAALADSPASPRVVTTRERVARTPERPRPAATATATPERRMKREAVEVFRSPDTKKAASRKRQRPSDAPRLLRFADVMEALTAEQRRVFEEKEREDLPSLLCDFHEALMGADPANIFAAPVSDEIAPGYSDVITSPMDFGTMLDSIERYSRFSRYFADVELVFSNAITYNDWGSTVGELVVEIQSYYIKFLLDAIGLHVKAKPKAKLRTGAHRVADPESPVQPKVVKRKRRAVSYDDDDDDDEGGWGSASSSASSAGSEEDDDAEEDSDDDSAGSASEPETESSDDDRPRRRRLTRGASKKSKPKTGKKKKIKRPTKRTRRG